MPTEKPRITLVVPEETLDAINEYRFQYKFKNQTQAILSLLELGFADLQSKGFKGNTITTELLPQEADMVKRFRALDERGKTTIEAAIDTQLKLQ